MDAGFLADICEHPEDDAPRLVYADWLDDHGDADRAEFIRVQCELARLDEFDDRRPPLVRRERALWVQHGRAWGKAASTRAREFEFRRGFVHRMTLDAGAFPQQAKAIFKAHPLRELAVRGTRQLDAVIGSPYMARLRGLELGRSGVASDQVGRLAASPQVRGLESLAVEGVTLTRESARAVVESPHLSALQELRLSFIAWAGTDSALDGLAGRHALRSLTRLSLRQNQLPPDAAGRLARCDRLEYLIELDLGSNRLSDDGVRELVASGRLRSLAALDLSTNELTPAGVRLLAGCPDLAALRHLRLVENDRCLDGPSAAALADSAALANLGSLGLPCAEADSPDVLVALLRAPFVPKLRTLTLGLAAPGSAAVLFGTAVLANAQSVSLTGFGQESVAQMLEVASATYMTALTHLSLESRLEYDDQQPALVDDGVTQLANAPHLAGLVALRLKRYPVGDATYRALIESPYLPRWCKLELVECRRPADQRALRDRFAEVVELWPRDGR